MQGKIYFHPHPCPLPSREREIGVFSSRGEGEKVIPISGKRPLFFLPHFGGG